MSHATTSARQRCKFFIGSHQPDLRGDDDILEERVARLKLLLKLACGVCAGVHLPTKDARCVFQGLNDLPGRAEVWRRNHPDILGQWKIGAEASYTVLRVSYRVAEGESHGNHQAIQ